MARMKQLTVVVLVIAVLGGTGHVATAVSFAPVNFVSLGRLGDDPVAAGAWGSGWGFDTVWGGGGDWWNDGEYGSFLYQPISGDFRIEADVTWINRTGTWTDMDEWVKAGLAVRNDVDTGPGNEKEVNYFTIHMRPDRHAVSHQGRPTSTSDVFYTTVDLLPLQDNRRISLNRTTVSGIPYVEGFVHDGTDWVKIRGDYALQLADSAYVGLAVTAHNNDGRLEGAEFRGVEIFPAWPATAPGRVPGTPVNDPENVRPVLGGWGVIEVVNNGVMDGIPAAVTSLESGGDRLTYNLMGPLNLNDHEGDAANFGNDVGYGVAYEGLAIGAPWPAPGSVDDLALLARGRVRIPSTGAYSFYIRSDNGEEMVVRQGSTQLILRDDALWDTHSIGTVNLTAGHADIQVIHREDYGEADLEVAAAMGATSNLDDFVLIGKPGLGTIPIPGYADTLRMVATEPGGYEHEVGDLPVWTAEINTLQEALDAYWWGEAEGTSLYSAPGFVNHEDPDVGGPGAIPGDVPFPNDVPGASEDDFAIVVEGAICVPEDGLYQIGYNSDDGAALQIYGQTWLGIVPGSHAGAVINGDQLITDEVTGWSWTAGEIDLTAGNHDFGSVMFDRAGGAFYEIFGRGQAADGAWDPVWHLLTVDSCGYYEDPAGLELIPAFDGDLNDDGFCGQDDLDIVLAAWGTSPPSDPRADPSGDNFVGQDDLDTVLGDWGQGTLPPSVPEPATVAMLAVCGLALLRRRPKSR